MTNHSPLPWKVTDEHYVDASTGDGRLQEVAYCGDCYIGSRSENAHLIVTAVNYYQQLRRALELAMDYIEKSPCDPDITTEQADAFRALVDVDARGLLADIDQQDHAQ